MCRSLASFSTSIWVFRSLITHDRVRGGGKTLDHQKWIGGDKHQVPSIFFIISTLGSAKLSLNWQLGGVNLHTVRLLAEDLEIISHPHF
jgi:hypothetical protein